MDSTNSFKAVLKLNQIKVDESNKAIHPAHANRQNRLEPIKRKPEDQRIVLKQNYRAMLLRMQRI